MKRKKPTAHSIFLKLSIIVIIIYLAIVAASLAITGFLFFTLDYYKPKIEKIIYKRTGYKLNLGSIKTTFNKRWLPQIILNNVSLSDKTHVQPLFHVNSIKLVISYASIWNFKPIFDTIAINGTTLTLSRTMDNKLLLNGLPFPENKLTNLRPHQLDTEDWVLRNSHISLTQSTFNFIDERDILPKITIPNVAALLNNSYFSHHDLNITTNITPQNAMDAKLTWLGGKISRPQDWVDGEFTLQTYTPQVDNRIPSEFATLNRLLSEVNPLKKLDAKTTIDAKLANGQLTSLQANFDFKDLILPFKTPITLPVLTGNINVSLANKTQYTLNATNLNLATKDGYILRNQKIVGNYELHKNGSININDVSISGFNNLLLLFPSTNTLSVNGNINSISGSWNGDVLHPAHYQIFMQFQNLTLLSKNADIPSINNISGDATLTENQGKLHAILKDSTLKYSKIFLIPYRFKTLDSNILFRSDPDKTFTVTLEPTKLSMIDFEGSAYGKYIYKPKTSGFLELHAKLNKILTSKVGDYLPTQIPISVHKWLNMALIGGYGVNGNLLLSGWLTDFPFSNNKGKFYIDADIENAKLRYVDTWPTLDNINGKFQIRNQKITIKTNNAYVNNNRITEAIVDIPDMTSDHAYLTADGMANGSTQNFMTYLKHTPVNAIIGKIPEKVSTTGTGAVKIHLKVPFDNPKHTVVDGLYTFNNNAIQFDLPIPLLNNVNGQLFFTDRSVKINNITATTLGAKINLSADTSKNGDIHFNATANNLDYNQLANYYVPFMAPLISGTATTNIAFHINNNGFTKLEANGQLLGVSITAAPPLYKLPTTITPFTLTMDESKARKSRENNGFDINFTYNNIFYGNFILNNHGHLVNSNLALGTKNFLIPKNYSPFKINTNLPKIDLFAWLNTIKTMLSKSTTFNERKPYNQAAQPEQKQKPQVIPGQGSSNQLFPMEIYLNTPELFLGESNFGKTLATATVTATGANFNINGTQIIGYGTYSFPKAWLDLNFSSLRVNKSATITKLTKHSPSQDKQSVTPHVAWTIPQECNAIITTPSPNSQQDIGAVDKTAQNCYRALRKLRISERKTRTEQQLNSHNNMVDLPTITLKSNQFFYKNDDLGKLILKLTPQKQDFILESGQLIGRNATINFTGANYCMKCGSPDAYVALKANLTVPNFGDFLNELDLKNIIAKGNGTIAVRTQWDGQFSDFNIGDMIAHINIDMKNGQFLKADTGSILGSIIGIITLQTIVNIVKLDFGSIFSNGFSFNSLKLNAYLIKNNLSIKYLRMIGTSAIVNTYGNIDVATDTLDLYLSVVPHFDTSVALGTAAATAPTIIGPVIVGAAYVLDWILGKPFNKLFTFSYHVTGTIAKPILTKTSISKQIVKNVNSTVGQ